jgi:hypothetical protein
MTDASPRRSKGPGRPASSIGDVARLAGVSTQTVSRVLNNSASLREETRARVLDAMAELDYRPNNAARALGTATTRTLGVVATDVTLHGPTVAVAALATGGVAAAATGGAVAVGTLPLSTLAPGVAATLLAAVALLAATGTAADGGAL